MLDKRIVLFASLLLIGAAAPLAIAQGPGEVPENPGPPDCLPQNVVDNEDVRVWFHGFKGQLKVWSKDNGSLDGGYQYKTLSITELDEDGDEAAWFNYERAYPQSATCDIEEDDTFLNITYTVDGAVRALPGDGPSVGDVTVTFEYHFNKTDDSAKFDLMVEEWPWQEEGTLAYGFEATSEEWTIEPADNGLGFEDEDGQAQASITWAENATATYEDEHTEEALVESTVDATDHHATVDLEFTNVTAEYVELDYDPTVGVGPYIIVANHLLTEDDLSFPEPVHGLFWAAATAVL